MKKVLFFLLLVFLSNKGFSQESNCEKFKTGKFLYTSQGLPSITVTRTETTQTEKINPLAEEVTGTIVWKSNCNYEFTFTKCPVQELVGKTLSVEIFDAKGKIAKGKSTFQGSAINFNIEKLD